MKKKEPKGTLSFCLSDPDQRADFLRATKATDMWLALLEVSRICRDVVRREYPPMKAIEEIREEIADYLD